MTEEKPVPARVNIVERYIEEAEEICIDHFGNTESRIVVEIALMLFEVDRAMTGKGRSANDWQR